MLVSDRLRRVLLDEEDEEWDLFSPAERSELIFHLYARTAKLHTPCKVTTAVYVVTTY